MAIIRNVIAIITVLLALTCGAQAQSANSGCGIQSDGISGAINSVILLSRTITSSPVPIASTDACKLLLLSSGASVLTLQAATTTGFGSGKYFWIDNQSGGSVTLNITTSTLDGSSSVTIANNSTIGFQSDGTNYHYFSLGGSGGGGGGCATANPTATAGPTAINGTASTCMRSDAAPAIQIGTISQPGLLQPDGTTITVSAGIISATGTVTSVSAACGQTTGTGAITTAGTIKSTLVSLTHVSGDTIMAPECGQLGTFNSGSAVAITLPQANTTGFPPGWFEEYTNYGAGTVTFTTSTSHFLTSGSPTTFALTTGQSVQFVSSTSSIGNWDVAFIAGGGGGSGTITAGSTVTASITSGDIMSSTSNLVADSGIAVSNVALLSGTQTLTGNKTFSGVATFAEVIGGTRTVSTGTTDTLLVTDCGKTVIYSSTSPVTVTVASATFAAGCNANVLQAGSNKVTISGSGVTVTSASSYTGTSGTAGAMIGLFFSSSTQAYLTGQGS